MNVRKRLEKLEATAEKATSSELPIELRVYLKTVERYGARERGEEPPPYDQEEIEELRRDDLEAVAGHGFIQELRDSRGWQSPEGQHILSQWEEGAKRRVEKANDLPPERWHEVWGVDNEDEEET